MLTKAHRPLIVAVVASLEDFERISNLQSGEVDLCELRIDLLPRDSVELLPLARRLRLPKIVTVRDPSEGGANALSEESRLQLFERWLPECDAIDIELKNISRFANLAEDARSNGKDVIVSFHDFVKTPPFEELMDKLHQSAIVPNRIFKAATMVESWEQIDILMRLINASPGLRVAVMGMGMLGKLSRLILAKAGSYLSYGSLGEVVVPGQWPVLRLRALMAEI